MRQLSKIASMQDRLREWQSNVVDRLIHLSCLTLKALDFNTIRIYKATWVTFEAMAIWAAGVRECVAEVGKNNLFINGEVTGGNALGSIYL